jgi:DNA-binding GntR family transcriptional regulator
VPRDSKREGGRVDVASASSDGRPRSRSPRFDSTEVQYTRLRKEILEGAFAPGTILLKTALSARYGVSRTPVREALGRLAQDGLIERSTRGFRIRQRDPEQILEIYEARIALEARSAELAARRRTEFETGPGPER